MLSYSGLERLGLELLAFNLEANKDLILEILKKHRDTLRHVSFSKNKVSNCFLNTICEGMSEYNNIEYIDLRDLKEIKSVDWV